MGILLCACPSHCAQILRAATPLQVHLHGLRISTTWPLSPSNQTATIFWAVLPFDSPPQALLREQQWRSHLLQTPYAGAIHMLYGHAAQQAKQLQPWVAPRAHDGSMTLDECQECLDAASERQLFQHLQLNKNT